MSAQIQDNRLPSLYAPNSHSQSDKMRGNLQGRTMEVMSTTDFQTYRRSLQVTFRTVCSNSAIRQRNGILYAVAGVVLIVAAVAIVCYLRAVIPATFIWPGGTRLLVSIGISAIATGGLSLLTLANNAFQNRADSDRFSNLVDNPVRYAKRYMVHSDYLQNV